MPFASGLRLGPYEIVALLGAGGMGEVYRARDLRLGREVAVKVLPATFASDSNALARFQREARAISSLSHPHICSLFDIGCENDTHFLVMEFLEGQTLREVIGARPLPFSSILELGLQIVSALQAAHARGIIHRDIKPANIFITRSGSVKLLDFGLAKFEQPSSLASGNDLTLTDTQLTMHGVPVGTVAYMSPEQAQGLPATFHSDLFSFGAVLYEMSTACRAFPGNSTAEIFAAILHSAPIPACRLNPALPREFDRVLSRLLEKAPEARYSSVREITAALQVFSGSYSASRNVSISPSSPPPAPQQLHSLAVLPLADLSLQPGQDYFVDGFTEALITAVARLGGLRVISRTSSMCYRNTDKSLPVIAQELNVDALLEGSVLRSGDRIRLTCRLVDPRNDDLLWSDTFDRDLRDVIALHDDITHSIASSIRARIQDRSPSGLTPPRHVHPEAYDSYLRGRFFWNKRNESSLKKALECFQHALDLDPLYAPAYTGVADSYFYLGYSFGRMDPNDAMPKARAAALRALDLDSHLAEAHCSLALVQSVYEWDWASAEASYSRSLALNPGFGTAHHFYSVQLSSLGRHEDSLRHIHLALQSDPLSIPINNFVGMMHFAARQYELAVTATHKTLEMDANFGLAHSVLGASLEAQGRADEAAAEYVTSLVVGRHDPAECESIRRAYEQGGLRGLHEVDLRHSLRRWNGWHGLAFDIAAQHAILDHRSDSLDWLERCLAARSGLLLWLNSGTTFSRAAQYFDNLRGEPRFLRLLQELRFPAQNA